MGTVLDTEFGIHCVAGNATLYRKLLGRFMDQQRNVVAEIQQKLAENDTETAERLAHTLKGVSASMGATNLSECATILDAALKKNENVDALLPATQQALLEAYDAITAYLATPA